MSALIPKIISVDVPIETSGEISVYEGIPVINKIDFGFYVVPGKHDIPSYMQSVDNGAFGPHFHYDVSSYISSQSYISAPPSAMTMLSDPYAYDLCTYAEPLSTCLYGSS